MAAAAGCSGHKELKTARSSVYDIDFAIVYSQTMAAVQQLYPTMDDEPGRGMIRTAWHQVALAQTSSDDPTTASSLGNGTYTNPATAQPGTMGAPQMQRVGNQATLTKRYFIRFDVSVLGGRPWRVHVVGHASEWEPGNAVPVELRGANVPHWLAGRTDELTLAIYRRLKQYAKPAPPEQVTAKPADQVKIDASKFGAIPAGAAEVATAIEKAVELRDYGALRGVVAADVVWSLGGEPGVDAALATWQADPTVLDALVAALDAGCASAGTKVTCPAAAAKPGFTGWRATLEARGAAWKLTSFVQGD